MGASCTGTVGDEDSFESDDAGRRVGGPAAAGSDAARESASNSTTQEGAASADLATRATADASADDSGRASTDVLADASADAFANAATDVQTAVGDGHSSNDAPDTQRPADADAPVTKDPVLLVTRDAHAALDRSSWKASASRRSDLAKYAIDGPIWTRYSTKDHAQKGDWFQLDLGSSQRFDRVRTDASRSGWSPDVDVLVSDDGVTWSGAVGHVASAHSFDPVTIEVGTQNKRFVRLVCNSDTNFDWWSIHELYLYEGDPGSGLIHPLAERPPRAWQDRLLNSDGTLNGGAYTDVASRFNAREVIDYRFGPDYSFYHDVDGQNTLAVTPYRGDDGYVRVGTATDWYTMSGQLLYSPDQPADPGTARPHSATVYGFGDIDDSQFDLRLSWEKTPGNWFNDNPDPTVGQKAWLDVSGGSLPTPPVATVRSHTIDPVTGFLLFPNGLVGSVGVGNDAYPDCCGGWPTTRLAPNKVPTAGCATSNNEFLLATVWDTAQQKGQVAVIAVQGRLLEQGSLFLYGLPNWPNVQGLKVLGYVDLPFAAPTSIDCASDLGLSSGRGQSPGVNEGLNLDSQAERDIWYQWSGASRKRASRSGFAVVASRAENRVAFLDLEPLFQYYRSMYFTTQSNYDVTKNSGPADEQWPFSFAHVASQSPTVVFDAAVDRPTAVLAEGPNEHPIAHAYVTTMDGKLSLYDATGLRTTGGVKMPTALRTVNVGRNPSHIATGFLATNMSNDLVITCRGDRALFYVSAEGAIYEVLQDDRMRDPVSTAVTGVRGVDVFSVMDFGGHQALNYVFGPERGGQASFAWATPIPGAPFMANFGEVP